MRFGASCLAIAIVLLSAVPLLAAGGAVITLPQPGTKIKSGLAMTIDMRGIDANGYRPVAVTVKPLNNLPLPADRQLRVIIAPFTNMSGLTPEVSQVIEIPEGSTSATTTIAIPQTGQWWSCSIDTFEDGEKLRDLSVERIGFPGINYWEWSEARPAMLIVDRNVPDRPDRDKMITDFKGLGTDRAPTYTVPEPRALASLFPDPNRAMGGATTSNYIAGSQPLSDAVLLDNLMTNYPRLELLPPAELPERWIELSQYDVVIISLAELRSLAKTDPARMRAVADWNAGGPVLMVYGVGADFAGLTEIEKLLQLAPIPWSARSASGNLDAPQFGDGDQLPLAEQADHKQFRGWIPAPPERYMRVLNHQLEDFDETSLLQMQPNYYARASRYVAPTAPTTMPGYRRGQRPDLLAAPAKPPFVTRPAGLGVVVGIATDNPFPGKDTDWIWIFNSVPRSHWMWYQRNGYSLHRQNADYWTFLIPGVGEAPVVSFLLLVSLFAVVIGPVNYMLLGKTGRYYLLLITVPIGALLVTMGLFTYAVVTDGLGVKLRARTFTDLDQRTGRAVAWSRQSYYASIAPSRGLTFPGDATVFPVHYEPAQRPRSYEKPDNTIEWDEEQHLTRGYITSRTNTQFVVLRATESQDKLAVTEGKSAGQRPQVANGLTTDITYLLLRDSRGDFWQTERLANGKSAALTAIGAEEAAERLKKLYGENPPELPKGYDPNLHNTAFSMFMPNYGWWGVDQSSTLPAMAASLLEKNLAQATRPGELAPGSYLAVTKSSPIAPNGVPHVREEASLHVIRGRY
ncbi:MAG: hypothetical protein L0211_13285 [Planctomycetaceae bacterium]|nr:hypothetical protein [Planctomycetaceae bacterium]